MEELSFFFTVIAVFGAVLNSYQRIEGFYLWALSNAFFIIFNIHNEHFSMVMLFAAYLLITLNGIYNWILKGE